MKLAFFMLFSHFGVFVQYLQLYFRSLGYGDAEVGLLMGMVQISGVAGPLVMGAIVDRRPITRTLLAVAITGASLLLVALRFTSGLASAIPIAIAIGLLFRSEVPLLDTHASLVLASSGEDYGRIRVWGTIGFVVVSLVFQVTGYPRPDIDDSMLTTFLFLGATFLIAVPFLPRAQAQTRKRTDGGGGKLPRAFWIVVVIVFLSNAGFSAHSAFFSLYVADVLPGFLVSGAWAIGAIAEIPAMLFGGRVIRRFGVRTMLIAATVAQVVRLLIYALAPQTTPVLTAQLLHALTFGALHTAGIGYVTGAVASESRARAVALYNAFGFGLPGLVGGILGGQLLEHFGFGVLFLVFAILPLIGVLVAVFSRAPIEQRVE